jgi:hypothetical protein
MAGGLGGLGGFGNILGAIGQSLLTSPRENPFQGLPSALQSVSKMSEHQAALAAMSTVAEKLGVPKELAASPEAMKLFIDHINATKLNQLRQQAAQGGTFTPPEDSPTSQPAMSVPGLQGSSGIPTTFNVAGGGVPGGLDGPGGLGGTAMAAGAAVPSFGEGAGRSGRPLTLRQGALSGAATEKGRAVFNGLVARGLSPVAAASITGNIRGESAFNPAAIGDQGTSGGLAQWHNERWSALKQRAAQQGKPWTDLDVQLDHLVSELKGPESGALAALTAARNPQEGALAFMRRFERPSNAEMARSGPLRASAAASALNLYGGGGGAPRAAANADVFAAPGLNINYAGDPKLSYGRTATANAKPFDSLVVHHTATPDLDSALSVLRKGDPKRGGQSFGYHFYIDKDGSITQGAPLSARTNHVAGSTGFNNASALGISLVGSGETTPAQEAAAAALGQRLAMTYGINPTRIAAHGEIDKGHQEDEGRSLAEQIRAGVSAPRPTQLASADPNAIPLPSGGIGQGGPGVGPNGPGIGQSGAPLNQVAAGRGRSLSVPIPAQTNIPIPAQTNIPPTPAATAPAAPPPTGTGDTRTKAAARAEFQRGMNILAASNGDPVLMKQAEIIMSSAKKYLEPSDIARRVSEAGLMGTPVGRAIIGGLPATAVEQLTEQQIPGYVSPSTLEQKKYRSAEEERAYQHSKAEHEARIAEAQRQYQNQFGERKFANEIARESLNFNLENKKFDYERYKTDRAYRQQVDNALIQNNFERQRLGYEGQRVGLEGEKFENTKQQQTIENQRAEAALRQQRDIATEGHDISRMTDAEKVGGAINAPERAPNILAGQAAEAARIANETTARGTATALTREAEAATNAGRMAARLMPALHEAREAYNELKKGGTGQFGGIGPSANNPSSRAIAARMPEWTPAFQNEMHRQRFDSAMAAIRSAKTAVDLKGQGPISNFERVLAGADLPDPAAVSAEVVEGAFTRLDRQLNAALELDRAVGLHGGQQPGAQRREEPSAPAPSRDGWIDMGNGVRVRRK